MPESEEEQALQLRQDNLDTLQGKKQKEGQCGCSVGSTEEKGVRSSWELGKGQNR